MKNLKQKLIDIFFDVDFTNSIDNGFKEYSHVYSNRTKTEETSAIENKIPEKKTLINECSNLKNSNNSKKSAL